MTGLRLPSLPRRAFSKRPAARITIPVAALGVLAGLGLSGCQGTSPDDVMFVALAGEAPADRPPYVDLTGATRLAHGAPSMTLRSFRPAVTPKGDAVGETARVLRAYDRVRQVLSDRDDELRLRGRSVTLLGTRYRRAVGPLRLAPGDPLPRDDARFRGRMEAARRALTALERETVRMSAVLTRLERDLAAAEAVAADARALAVDTPEPGTDRSVRPALIAASKATLATGRDMAEAAREDLGEMVEYVSRQREALNSLEAQVREAG